MTTSSQQPTMPHWTNNQPPTRDPIQQLHQIPDLAAEAWYTRDAPNPGPTHTHTARPKPGSRPNLNTTTYDALRTDHKGLLHQLHGCTIRTHQHTNTPPTPEPAWAPVCQWLITHQHAWTQHPNLNDHTRATINQTHTTLAGLCRIPNRPNLTCSRLGCGAPTHLKDGNQWLQCDNGHTLDLAAERNRFLAMQNWTLTETRDAARTWLGHDIPLNTLKTWAKRGTIRPITDKHPLRYNFGAVQIIINQRKMV